MSNDGLILKFERDESGLPPLVLQRKPREIGQKDCNHNRSWIDKSNRRIYCQACGAELDPYEVLGRLADYGMRLDHHLKEIRDYQKTQAETAKRIANEKRGGLPAKLARVSVGDRVSLKVERGYSERGYVKEITPDAIALQYKTVKIADIVDITITRKRAAP